MCDCNRIKLVHTLNFSVRKAFVESNYLLKNFKLMKNDEYLEVCLKADPLFLLLKN